MAEVFVGCGSNIEPEKHMRWALRELTTRFGPLKRSSVYRSAAHGFDGPDFLNMVVGFETAAPVDAVESALSALEAQCGRHSGERAGSRTLDLDLLLYGQRVDPAWRLPREDIDRYAFVRVPLIEIAPTLRHPLTGMIIGEHGTGSTEDRGALRRVGALDGV